MDILDIKILDTDKLESKHNVRADEVEDVLWGKAKFYFAQEGNIKDEDVYRALGRTSAGRYMIVFFIYKMDKTVLVLSAREMTDKERKRYGKK